MPEWRVENARQTYHYELISQLISQISKFQILQDPE